MSTVYWYRITDDMRAGTCDEWDNPGPSTIYTYMHSYEVLRETPKGVWLKGCGPNGKRFCLKESRKRFACATKEQALESFRARKTKQANIYHEKARRAQEAIVKAEDMILRGWRAR